MQAGLNDVITFHGDYFYSDYFYDYCHFDALS